jgi:hypothetical protein
VSAILSRLAGELLPSKGLVWRRRSKPALRTIYCLQSTLNTLQSYTDQKLKLSSSGIVITSNHFLKHSTRKYF